MKKLTSMLICLCLMLAMCAMATAEASIFAGGAGTEDDPWQIATAEHLLALSAAGAPQQRADAGQQLAAGKAELDAGTRYWFDEAETAAIMEHNRRFQQQSSAELFFHQYFEIPESEDKTGEWMTTTAILLHMKKEAGSTFQPPAANSFGRTLRSLPDIQYRRSKIGSEFYVRVKNS